MVKFKLTLNTVVMNMIKLSGPGYKHRRAVLFADLHSEIHPIPSHILRFERSKPFYGDLKTDQGNKKVKVRINIQAEPVFNSSYFVQLL